MCVTNKNAPKSGNACIQRLIENSET